MRTKVVNLKSGDAYDVYIGRPSPFGNPYSVNMYGREKALDLYRSYFALQLLSDSEFRERVHALKGKTLGCFCKPLDCHGDIIAEYVNGREE
jgi:hypothetical protein